jgi:RNA recognition motif-containing protein
LCRALEMDGQSLMGRTIKVMYAQPSQKCGAKVEKGLKGQRCKNGAQYAAKLRKSTNSAEAADNDPLEA